MASQPAAFRFSCLLLAFCSFFCFSYCDDTSDQLFKGINTYRSSLNLSALTVNKNADCLAEQLAEQFKGQPCSNSTGANTVPGTEPQFPKYPTFLDHCHLNATVTQDGMPMPACVPGLDSALVLANFTKSQYSANLNDSKYVGAGIASEGDWVVVVLTTNTPGGSFTTASSAVAISKVSVIGFMLTLFWGSSLVLTI